MSEIYTSVVGVSFRNDLEDGGQDRQEIIAWYHRNSSGLVDVDLFWEPDNPNDANAIAVHFGGEKVGYLPRDISKRLNPHLIQGGEIDIIECQVTGGPYPETHYGIDIVIAKK